LPGGLTLRAGYDPGREEIAVHHRLQLSSGHRRDAGADLVGSGRLDPNQIAVPGAGAEGDEDVALGTESALDAESATGNRRWRDRSHQEARRRRSQARI